LDPHHPHPTGSRRLTRKINKYLNSYRELAIRVTVGFVHDCHLLAVSLALTAAVGTSGLAGARSANAAGLGEVVVLVEAQDVNSWDAGYHQAVSSCGRMFPETQSVEWHSSYGQYFSELEKSLGVQTWGCRDTP
jgi:hypothetical protein